MFRPLIVTAVLAATLALGGTALAGGPGQSVTLIERLDLTVDGRNGVLKGTLVAHAGRCVGGRTVTFLRRREGKKKVLGADRSTGKGRFKLTLNGFPKEGRYFVRVKRRTSAGVVCLPVTSPKIEVTVNE